MPSASEIQDVSGVRGAGPTAGPAALLPEGGEVDAWNRTDAEFPADRCIHQLFEAQAAATPDAPAVLFGRGALTYAELNARANRLARHLSRLGAGPETRVAVCLERGLDLVAALLGVLKAGAAYVPLDPAYPAERLALMLADAGAAVLLTQETLRALVDLPASTAVVRVDGDAAAIARESTDDPEIGVHPRNLAYLIYTSGSTGIPKGVAIEHESAVAMLAWAWSVYSPEELGGMLAATSVCFDMSVFELFAPLTRGGRVIVVENALALPSAPAAGEVRLVDTVPSAIAALLDSGGIPAGVRTVNLGGELLRQDVVDALYARGIERVYDLYGPSEDTTFSTFALRAAGGAPTIGRPISNTRCHVVDDALRPVAVGVAGELFIGGRGVTRGYLGRPALTAERYVPDPFSATPGTRMYRTGDRVRWVLEGAEVEGVDASSRTAVLEYLGRLDHQVKVRGFRVELGEIESALRRHPDVRDCVVVAREDGPGDRRLAAYAAGSADVDSLRAHLRRSLPDYMVPGAFVLLDALPLLPNGKVDRGALPAPEAAGADGRFAAARTATEAALSRTWCALLGQERVSVDRPFLELGAHSLLGIRVIARIEDAFGVRVPPETLLRSGTIQEIAALIDGERGRRPAGAGPALERVPRDRPIPLSFSQEATWFFEQFAPGQMAYRAQATLRFHGPLDVPALERALTEIVRRHEIFRTTFEVENGEPVQRIHPPWPVHLPVHDVSEVDPARREAAVEEIVQREFVRPIDVARLPLLWWSVVRVAPGDHVLTIVEHHFVHDGWSFGVFLRELRALYLAYAEGREPRLPEPAVQFADFAVWQRRWMESEAAREGLRFWEAELGGVPPLELPGDHPRPAVMRFRGARERVRLPPALAAEARRFSRAHGATFFTTLMAAFQALMGRYAGQRDFCVGSGLGNRGQVALEDVIGMVVNTVGVRADLSGDPTGVELLRRVRDTLLRAAARQDVPFDQVVRRLAPERTTSALPVYQVAFHAHDSPMTDLAFGGTRVELNDVLDNGSAKFDLQVTVVPRAEQGLAGREDEVVLVWEYATELFAPETVRRMARHYEALLEQLVRAPERRLSALELAAGDERRRVLEDWNRTDAPYPSDRPIHALFAEQAARAPDAVAVVAGEAALTYAELDARANRLARHLARRGVGVESRVGICLERGPELVVALLAVLKAGGAYVPLDPAYPAERLALMLADSGVSVLLTQGSLRERLPAAEGVALVRIDGDAEGIAAGSAEPFDAGASAGNLAYVIYTSGSMGTPKGVAVEHRGVVRLVRGVDYVALGAEEAILAAAPVSFDASTFETWGALLNGGRMILVPAANPTLEELGRAIRRHGVTTMWLTAGLFQAMVEERLDDLAGVRQLLAGGDVLPAEAVRKVRERFPALRLVNGYGPTENTTFTCCHVVDDAWDGGPVPIGAPISNTRVYVLDEALRPAPIGVPGELYAGGAGVARGYLDRPGLTAERFVPDPFAIEPGARLYRTGDRVRWRADGALEYLGRLDAQVKVRGFRIELGEIESVLRRAPDVRECVVVARTDVSGDRRLVAYVVGAADADGVRAHLRRTLPDYMLPGAIVVLDALPLTPNGKLDRRALPAPDAARAEDASRAAPSTAVEEVLAAIWAELLRVDTVGADDDFFALGGHSLVATRVVSRIREALGVELPLRALFEGPTVAQLAKTVEALRRSDAPRLPPVVPVDRNQPLPLSFAQERLWFLDRLEPGNAVYNVARVLRLRGPLDAGALERALGEVVRRHEALRTTFREAGNAPVQVVAPFCGFSLPVEDLSALDGADREAAILRRAAAEAAHAYDLASGPLFRPALLRLGADEHVLLLAMHHVVCDEWSLGVLFRELAALYEAHRDGQLSPLPELPVQYADFAAWQREQLRGEALQREIGWWKERLAGAPALLELPADHPRPAVRSHRGAREHFELPADLAPRLRALARREGATLYMVLLGAFQALLAKYAGSDDVVVGSPIAGRTRGETEGLIGFFVNTLALRMDLSGDPAFREVLRRVRAVMLGAHEHQDVPFERLVAELQPERSQSHSPLFQVMFTLEDATHAGDELPGLATERIHPRRATSKFDLTLSLSAHPGGIGGALEYSTDLFERATILRLVGHLERVLEQVAEDADRRLSRLELPGEAERRRVLEEWNRTDAAHPDRPIHQQIADQARRTPDAVAVTSPAGSLTYRELDARANRLAHHLRRMDVGPESRVGICLERSPELVVAVLAVLKAGGAYVPLDPGYPAERLQLMLADSAASVLLTRDGSNSLVPSGVRVVSVDAVEIGTERDDAPAVDVHPKNLALVIYTSGSTGTPKGAGITHGGLANYLAWFDRAVLGTDGFALPMVSRVSFDAHVRQLYPPLLRGESVWVLPDETAADPKALLAALAARADRVSFGGVPSLWSAMVGLMEAGDAPKPAGLVAVLLGGEALPRELADRTFALYPDVALWNHYGPTEATVNTSVSRVRPGEPIGIGRPVGNARVYLLDAHGQPAPIGVPGELYVGGAGVSRGYLGRPGLTAERFVPDPFAAEAGARMYRSGDRARWRADGELEYAGRLDHQVKVRGFRIEPGEVEAVLRRQPGVREAAVVAREDAPGDRRLVAYVAGDVNADGLRDALRRSLPDYMVPAAFIVLDHLPKTSSGKLDRRALPAPELGSDEARFVAPRTPVEEVLAAVWGDVLMLERVGIHDDFFELGGHSLLATVVVGLVREAFGIELPLRALFEGPTVAELAERVEALRRADHPPLPPVVPVDRSRPLPLSFAQERLWFLHEMEPDNPFYNVANALRMQGPLDVRALERALGEIVRRHEALRTTFRAVAGVPLQVIVPFAGFALPVHDLAHLDGGAREAEAAWRAADEAARPFDLAAGPLFRATLLRLADEEHVLLLSMNHIVTDWWSTGILLRELSALYGAYANGEPSPLPELAVQYADHAVWQRARLRDDALARPLAYWKERLDGAPALLELPTDRPRPVMQSYRGAHVPFEVGAELAGQLRALGRREGATPYMVMLAAFQVLLAKYAGTDDVVVGSPIAGRTRREVDGLIGFFVNTLVLRTDLSGDPSFREALRRVRDVTLGAYDHQEMPFERLVAELQPERSLGHSPLFQAMLTWGTMDGIDPDLPGLRTELSRAGKDTARFDLTLGLADAARGLRGMLEYGTDLFDRTTIERMAEQLSRVLRQVVDDAGRRLSALDLLDAAERRLVTETWNSAVLAAPGERRVHEQFAAHAARAPHAPAVADGERTLSYGALEARASRLARALRRRGVGPDVPAGILAERGPELVLAQLAVLKAGGAYLPLDPDHPSDRLGWMLADAGASVLLTVDALRDRIPASPDLTLLFVDADAEAADVDADDADAAVSGDADVGAAAGRTLAYVIYTSGSTGRPKGVAVEHRGLTNVCACHAEALGIGPADRSAMMISPGFDAAALEVWPFLSRGACVDVVPREARTDPPAFRDWIVARGVTVVTTVPLMAEPLLRLEWPASAALRWINSGAERLQARPAPGSPFRLRNNYGPTETSITVAATEVEPAGERPPTIGRPLANVRACVLDGGMRPVPIGIPGELCVGGVHVARGYLGHPALTAERFVPDPVGTEPGARLYRTGDRVRWLADGTLDFLGRADEQVKIRGFRVEPGEVEAALAAHPGVADARVVVREDAPGQRRLVAYVVGGADADDLRVHLRRTLPEYMVPAAFVALDRLPVTASGKVDRRALPAPEHADGEAFVAPRDAVEEALAAIWADVLGVERVGVHDDFFELGGHSLLATRVIARVRETLDGGVGVVALFEHPTIGRLARCLADRRAAGLAAPPDAPLIPARSRPAGPRAEPEQLSDEALDRLLAADLEEGAAR